MRRVRLKHNRRPFLAYRDSHGVPRIEAESYASALYGLGYMQALDRPTQILFARAVAQGRSAELISDNENLLEMDRFFRRVGLYLNLKREVELLDETVRHNLEAFCEGLNDSMLPTRRSLPMWAVGFQPEPWDVEGVLLIGNLLNFNGLAVGQQQSERLILEMVQEGIEEKRLRELFSPLLDDADLDLLRQVKISSQLSDEALELITDLPRLAGSNAWAIMPNRSESGGALLAADPHLEINRLPAIWYEAVLQFGDRYLMGATLPGCPTFGVGRTADVAWGVTYLKGDTSDYFIEDVRQHEGNWQYRRGESWHDFDVRSEIIRRKGTGEPHVFHVYSNDQGTLEGDPNQLGPGYQLLVSWIGDHEGVGRSVATWVSLVEATSAREAMNLVRECPQPTLTWVFADRRGHVGQQSAGWFPKRAPGCNGAVPPPAWDETNHWRGRLSNHMLPSEFDPPRGFVATANEPINPEAGPKLVTLPTPDYRKRRLDEELQKLPQATIRDMQRLQYDVVNVQARDLLEVFLPHLPDGEVKEKLSAWDYSYDPTSVEATIFTRLYRQVLVEIFGQDPQRGGIGWRRIVYLASRTGFSTMMVTCIDRVLMQEDSSWWAPGTKELLITAAGVHLDEELKKKPAAAWRETNAFRFTNRFFEGTLVGKALGFHTGDRAMPGCFATLFQGHLLKVAQREATFAPSYHFVTDLNTDDAWTNLPGGPSESRFSKYYRSDIPLWETGEYKHLDAWPHEEEEADEEEDGE
ncbi:MAG: penicillin acylase family protein [Pirellulales bacterium]|nr:penicillin acylase family protein [Pirellulales bacterium]